MFVIDFIIPIESFNELNLANLDYKSSIWLPNALIDKNITIDHVAIWKKMKFPNEQIVLAIAFISDADTTYLKIKYPEITKIIHQWPLKNDDELFFFDK